MPLVSTFGNLSARAFGLGAAAKVFSPLSLFAAGEQGVWYDPSDLTTMFEDKAGTTPVHTPGNGVADSPVGALLDKRVPVGSKGYFSAYFDGTGDYVTAPANSAFQFGTGDFTIECWVNLSATGSNDGVLVELRSTQPSNTGFVFNTRAVTGGYKLNMYTDGAANLGGTTMAYNVWNHVAVSRSGSTVKLFVNGVVDATITKSNNFTDNPGPQIGQSSLYTTSNITGSVSNLRLVKGTAVYTANFTVPTSPLTAISGTSLSTFQNSTIIDNSSNGFTITKYGDTVAGSINPFGNHATQATSTARPKLSARYNLLTYSEALDNAAWTKTNMTATDGATDPNGGSTAETLVASAANGTVTQSFTAVATDYTFSVYLKRKTGTGNIDISCNSGGTWVTKTITSSWAQYSVTQTLTAGSKTPGIRIVTSGDEVYAWGADLRVSNDGVGLPAYQRIADANTYDSTGFPYYLKADGTDDSLATAAISFTSTNKMTVVSGLRKLSDSALAAYAELSATIASNNGTFLLSAPNSAAANYNFSSKGTTQVDNTVTTYTAPITSIITGIGDISAPNNQIRVNGSLAGTQTGSQGTGNYGNFALYLFRRNSASSPFNGRSYGLIIRGASSTSTEIANAETWLNTKTKAY